MAIRAEDIDAGCGTVDLERDRHLVLRHQRGEVGAFDELYRRYHGRLVAYCTRRVGDRHTAEEIAQEAFVRAYRAMPSFAGPRRFYPWMTVIAQRLCVDHHRRNARVEPAAEIDAGSCEPDLDHVDAAVDRDLLAAAVERLAPRHREILELREHHGRTYQQIAEHLDVPMTTVEALLHRARKALRREFLAVGGDPGRFGAALLAGGAFTRIRRWLTAAGGPERWAPLAGTAAAGTIAAALVAGPLTAGRDADTAALAPPPAPVVVTTDASPSTPLTEVAVVVPPPAAPSKPSAPAGTGQRRPSTRPVPTADAGVVEVYTGAEGTAWAEDQNAQQPVHVPLGPVADVGLHPTQLAQDVLDLTLAGGAP